MSPRCAGSRQGRRPIGPAWRVEGLEGRQLLAAYFTQAYHSIIPQSGPALVELTRYVNDPSGAAETVEIGLSGGTAVRGVDYPESVMKVRFEPGESVKTIKIPVLAADPTLGTRRVILTIPQSPDSWGEGSSATLSIAHSRDATPPRVVSARAILTKGNVTAFVLTFSEDMQRRAVEDVSSYTVTDPRSALTALRKAGPRSVLRSENRLQGVIDKGRVPISSAVYDPATRSVTLTVAGRLRRAPLFGVQNRELADSMNADAINLATSGFPPTSERLRPESRIADLAGNLLDSGTGTPDGFFLQPVTTGRRAGR